MADKTHDDGNDTRAIHSLIFGKKSTPVNVPIVAEIVTPPATTAEAAAEAARLEESKARFAREYGKSDWA